MYPRIKLARNLLTDDGVIFISINDNELFNLKKVCDEIFGEINFIADIIWTNKEGGGSSDSKLFRIKHEHILIYSKDMNFVKIKGIEISNKNRYTLSDEFEDIRGKFYLQKMSMGSIHYSKSLDYPITAPDGKIIMPKDNNGGKKACWRWSREKLNWGFKNKFIVIKKDSKGIWTVYSKQYLNCDNEGNIIKRTQRPTGIVDKFSSTQASKLMKKLDLQLYFSYSKPYELIDWIINRVIEDNDLLLDFFAGSSTSAHSILDLNLKYNVNNKFIMVQIPEATDEKSEAYKAGFKNICEIGKERIRRAGDKIVEESGNKDLDIGFKVFKLDSSNLEKWDPDYNNLEQTLLTAQDNIKQDRTHEDLIYEIMLKYGIDLTLPIEKYETQRNTIYSVGFGSLLICLDNNVTKEIASEILKLTDFEEVRVVFKDNGFNSDSEKTNIKEILKINNIDEFITI